MASKFRYSTSLLLLASGVAFSGCKSDSAASTSAPSAAKASQAVAPMGIEE